VISYFSTDDKQSRRTYRSNGGFWVLRMILGLPGEEDGLCESALVAWFWIDAVGAGVV
jgi:hypothetical protein